MSTQLHRKLDAATSPGDVLELILRFSRSQLIRYAASRLRNPCDADDVLQAACIAFLRFYRPEGEGEQREAAARGYLYAAIASAASKHQRTLARKPLAGAVDFDLDSFVGAEPDVDDVADSREKLSHLLRLVARLPERQRIIVSLQAAGYSTAEVCELLGISERARRRAVSKANRALREHDGG